MMKKSRIYILAILILMNVLPFGLSAQELIKLSTVTATVTDLAGGKIDNATVLASNAKTRTVTDQNGSFSIDVMIEDYLVLTCVGYEKTVLKIEHGKLANSIIVMPKWGVISPDATIRISNGNLKFSRITGSVERITGEELADFPTHSVIEALSGRLSGVLTAYGSAAPTVESFGMSVRGNGLGLTYQDGVPSDLTETPDEINEIIVAKDFGSSFLYGGGASNGALIVDSKKGNKGEQLMTFKVRTGVRTPVFTPEMMDAQTYAQSFNTALVNDGLDPFYTPEAIAAYGNNSDPVRYPNHNYYKELVDNTATYKHVTGNFSGGGNTVKYFSHLGYYGANGIESVGEGSNLTRLRIKNNVEVDLNQYGKISIGIGGSFIKRTSPNLREDNLFSTMYSYPANAMPYMINDTLYAKSSDYGTNMLVDLAHGSVIEDIRRDGYTRLAFDLDLSDITEGLSFNAAVSMYIYNNLTKSLSPTVDMAEPLFTKTVDGRDTIILRNQSKGAPDTSWGKAGDRVDRNQYLSSSINYDRTFSDKHMLTANLVYAQRTENGNTYYQEFKERNIGLRANYLYNNKYVLDVNLMNIGVRQLDDKERKKIYYAVGAAWLAHEESFLKDVEWIDFLKVRANYGVMGLPFQDFFLTQTQYVGSGAGSFGVNGNNSSTSGYVRAFTGGDKYVLPKRAYLNVGFDYQLFGSKVNGQFNYFNIRNFDQLTIPTNLYALMPVSSYMPFINYVDTKTTGFDGRVSYQNSIGKFKYSIDANAMYLGGQYTKTNSVNYPENDRNLDGNKFGRIVGLDADGIFQSQTEIDAHPIQMFGEVKAGDIRYKDYNNDGVVDEKDYHEIGHGTRLFYGLNLRVGYKNWSFSVHGDGRAMGSYIDNRNTNKQLGSYTAAMAESWPISNNLPRLSTFSVPNNTRTSTFWMNKAGYFNLRSVNLAYDVSQKLLEKTLIKEASIYVAAKNLMVLSSTDDKYMPSTEKGFSDYPVLNAIELGLQISF